MAHLNPDLTGDPDDYDADYYDGNGQADDRPALKWYAAMAKRYLGGGPYLDFGCGTGHLLRRLSQSGPASGFEISPYSARRAEQTAPGCTVYSELAAIPDSSFGALVAIHVVEHLDEPTLADVLAAWRRVLKPGGRALVVTPDRDGRASTREGATWRAMEDPTHINVKSHAQWQGVLGGAGFTVLREGSDGMWNVPYGRAPKLVDAAFYAVPSLLQFLSGRLWLAPGTGESALFVIQKQD
jgi:SAM-dependent methyltransferase